MARPIDWLSCSVAIRACARRWRRFRQSTLMPTSGPIAAILPLALLAGFATDAIAVQSVDFANVSRNGVAAGSPLFVAAGDRVKFDAVLTANGAANPPGTSGLSLCLEYPRG